MRLALLLVALALPARADEPDDDPKPPFPSDPLPLPSPSAPPPPVYRVLGTTPIRSDDRVQIRLSVGAAGRTLYDAAMGGGTVGGGIGWDSPKMGFYLLADGFGGVTTQGLPVGHVQIGPLFEARRGRYRVGGQLALPGVFFLQRVTDGSFAVLLSGGVRGHAAVDFFRERDTSFFAELRLGADGLLAAPTVMLEASLSVGARL